MTVEVLRCFKNDDVYGEYYVHTDDGRKTLVIQNGIDIKAIVHLNGKRVDDCVLKPKSEIIEAVVMASVEYLKESNQ